MAADVLNRELPDSFDEPLPVALPAPASVPHRWDLSIGMLVYLQVTVAGLLFIVPRFSEVYVQMKLHLPFMTRVLLGLSRGTEANLCIVGILLVALSWSLGRLRGCWASIASSVVSIGAIATWAWMSVALFSPLIILLEGIGHRQH